MTGWGQDGPDALRAGHDINYIALTGALEPIAAPGGGPPVPPLNMLGDFGGGGMLLAVGIISALLHAPRIRPGAGRRRRHRRRDRAAHRHDARSCTPAELGSTARGENLFDGGAPYYGVYRCADGGWLSRRRDRAEVLRGPRRPASG